MLQYKKTRTYKYIYMIAVHYYVFRAPTDVFRNPHRYLDSNGALENMYDFNNIKK